MNIYMAAVLLLVSSPAFSRTDTAIVAKKKCVCVCRGETIEKNDAIVLDGITDAKSCRAEEGQSCDTKSYRGQLILCTLSWTDLLSDPDITQQ